MSETSGHFKRLLVSMCQGAREENAEVDIAKAKREAQELYQAGEKKWGTDESKFNQIIAVRSFPQLRATFNEYVRVSYMRERGEREREREREKEGGEKGGGREGERGRESFMLIVRILLIDSYQATCIHS